MELNRKKVMLYGGSYNPIHQGHINAAINASKFVNADEVWLMPRRYNYDGSLLLDGKHRVKMIELAISHLDNFKVCDIELKDKDRKLIYTYHTAKKLTRKYKDIDFYFLIGADQLNNLKRWYESEKLTKLFKFVCYQRPGYIINQEIVKQFDIKVIDGPLVDVSSTIVRSGVFSKINEDIQNYIKVNQLYLKERVMPRLTEERFIHVLSTAKIAKKIALSNNVDTNQAYVAGILHDIAKGLSHDEILAIMEEFYPSKIKEDSFAYHAYVSEYIALHEFGITDKKILKAIRSHCLATKNMSKLDKIIYCADKLEESRPFATTLNDIRKVAYDDVDRCFILVMKDQYDYYIKNNKYVNPHLLKMIEFYERKLDDGR